MSNLYLLIGECKVHLGNLLDTDEEETDEKSIAMTYYEEAVECFTNLKEIDPELLPQEFEDFLNEWKGEITNNA